MILVLEEIILRKQILSYLEKNSKMDSKEIAILLGTEPDVVENEIRKMEEEKIICGYTAKNNQCIGTRCPFNPQNA